MSLRRTALHEWHASHGARLVPFAGWEMPLQYSSILQEHEAVRRAAGLFDVSHMGKLLITGENAAAAVNRVSTNDVPPDHGRARYTHLCDEEGRILDDVIFTVLDDAAVFCVCNAGTRERVIAWLQRWMPDCVIDDATDRYLCLALQGPRAFAILRKVLTADPAAAKPFRGFATGWRGVEGLEGGTWTDLVEGLTWMGAAVRPCRSFLVTRTGYTGEEGVELFPPAGPGEHIWEGLSAAGAEDGLKPCGLGARDTLRLEKGYLLSGQDFDGTRTSLEASCEWLVKWDHEFVGREAMRRQKEVGGFERLTGILLNGPGVPRHGSEVFHGGQRVGVLTSGTLSPTLRRGIGLAYLPPDVAEPGTAVAVRVRGEDVAARVVKPPFV